MSSRLTATMIRIASLGDSGHAFNRQRARWCGAHRRGESTSSASGPRRQQRQLRDDDELHPAAAFQRHADHHQRGAPNENRSRDFDKGGEDVRLSRHHDRQRQRVFRTNENVDIKTTADTDGGTDQSFNRFRVTDTAVGEFLTTRSMWRKRATTTSIFASPRTPPVPHVTWRSTAPMSPARLRSPTPAVFDVMTTVTRPGVRVNRRAACDEPGV